MLTLPTAQGSAQFPYHEVLYLIHTLFTCTHIHLSSSSSNEY